MTDAFSRLRTELYLEHDPSQLVALRTLAAAIAGKPLDTAIAGKPLDADFALDPDHALDPVLEAASRMHAAAALKSTISSAQLTALAGHQRPLEQLGRCSYQDRFLARLACRGDAACRAELERELAAAVLDRRLDAGPALAFCRSAALRPFDPVVVRQLLRVALDPQRAVLDAPGSAAGGDWGGAAARDNWGGGVDRAGDDRRAATLVELIGYIGEAGLSALVPELCAVLQQRAYPWGVRVEALLALSRFLDPADTRRRAAAADLAAPADILPDGPAESGSGLAVGLLQTVFYGDPARLGKGGSGGLGSLVRELGGELGERLAPVVTVVCYDSNAAAYPYRAREALSPRHLLLRMPVYLERHDPTGFLRNEHRIKAAVDRILTLIAPEAALVHVRFLDNASRAVARAARGRGLPLVVTLTPDPHRTVCSADGRLVSRAPSDAAEIFNRIAVGDELLRWSRGVIGIGRDAFSRELIPYFPQLENLGSRVIAGIDEGVSTRPVPPSADPETLLFGKRDPGLPPALDRTRFDLPLLLTVGRLCPIKGQATLVRAWAQSGLHKSVNLVIVGGDLQQPSQEERAIRDEIVQAARGVPAGRLCHLPAQENRVVRGLLAWCAARRPRHGYDAYVCPSVKEEFGLSILEAMAAGMPVLATLRGGPRSYIAHGVNGYLIDTGTAAALRHELWTILVENRLQEPALQRLKAEARSTVERRYSLGAMADQYAAFYRRVRTLHTADTLHAAETMHATETLHTAEGEQA